MTKLKQKYTEDGHEWIEEPCILKAGQATSPESRYGIRSLCIPHQKRCDVPANPTCKKSVDVNGKIMHNGNGTGSEMVLTEGIL